MRNQRSFGIRKSPKGVAWVSADLVTTANIGSVPVVAAPPPPPTNVDTTPPPATQCVLVGQDPADNTTFPTSYGFQMTWVLKNTSSTARNENDVDLVFLGAINGQRFHQNYDLYDITRTVNPSETYTVSGGMTRASTVRPGRCGREAAISSAASGSS